MDAERQEQSTVSYVDLPASRQGYCPHGDVGTVMHDNTMKCMAYDLERLRQAAVNSGKAISTLNMAHMDIVATRVEGGMDPEEAIPERDARLPKVVKLDWLLKQP